MKLYRLLLVTRSEMIEWNVKATSFEHAAMSVYENKIFPHGKSEYITLNAIEKIVLVEQHDESPLLGQN